MTQAERQSHDQQEAAELLRKSLRYNGPNVSQSSVVWMGPYEFDSSDYTGVDLGDPDNGFAWLPFVGPSIEPGSFVGRLFMDITEAFPAGTATLVVKLGEALPEGGPIAKWSLQDGDIESIIDRGVRVAITMADQERTGPVVVTINETVNLGGVLLTTNNTGPALIEASNRAWWIECSQWGQFEIQPPFANEVASGPGHGRLWFEIITPIEP